jgi:hypothetical protein
MEFGVWRSEFGRNAERGRMEKKVDGMSENAKN